MTFNNMLTNVNFIFVENQETLAVLVTMEFQEDNACGYIGDREVDPFRGYFDSPSKK